MAIPWSGETLRYLSPRVMFIASKPNKVLIGVDNYKQFEEILTIRNNRKIKLPYIANFNENLINPSRW